MNFKQIKHSLKAAGNSALQIVFTPVATYKKNANSFPLAVGTGLLTHHAIEAFSRGDNVTGVTTSLGAIYTGYSGLKIARATDKVASTLEEEPTPTEP